MEAPKRLHPTASASRVKRLQYKPLHNLYLFRCWIRYLRDQVSQREGPSRGRWNWRGMCCYKLALRFDRDDMIMHFLTSQRSGFYFSVIEEGEVQAGSKVEILSRDPHRVAVVEIVRLYLRQARDPDLLHRAMNVSALPQNWKAELTVRVDHA
jgi:hypothetical protein